MSVCVLCYCSEVGFFLKSVLGEGWMEKINSENKGVQLPLLSATNNTVPFCYNETIIALCIFISCNLNLSRDYTIISSRRTSFASETNTWNSQQQFFFFLKREECNISHNSCRSQAVLCGDRVGRLADAAELLRPLSYSGCGHVAGAAGGGCSQPW